jgi:PucR C-terminal helix-turn-helix domain/GGDEF-like domain
VDVSGAVILPEVARADVRAERGRILATLLDRLDELADRALAGMILEIPFYREQGERFHDDVRDQLRAHYGTQLAAFLEDRAITLADIAFVRGAATRRARAGCPLEGYINAFRVGHQVFWDAAVECAGETSAGHEAALALAGPIMRYCDFASMHAANAYVEFQQHVVADADRQRRDLLEHLLGGELPAGGPLLAGAHGYGIGADSRLIVAVAVPVDAALDADAPQIGSAALARVGLHESRTLVVVRHAEIVAVPALGPDPDSLPLYEQLEAMQRRLSREGLPLAMGISTVARGVAEVPRAYREAHAALEGVGEDGGVAALGRLSPFDYLARRADDTARRLVDPRLRAFLDDDRGRGSVLTATIRAMADADLNLRLAAERLQVHPNTAQYRLRRIEERTGRSPRCIADLVDLLVAIALDDAAS